VSRKVAIGRLACWLSHPWPVQAGWETGGWRLASALTRILKRRRPDGPCERQRSSRGHGWTGQSDYRHPDHPAEAQPASRWRIAGSHRTVVCSAGLLPRSLSRVFPPGHDGDSPGGFSAIREARQRVRREDLGLPGRAVSFTVTLSGWWAVPAWAMAMLHQVWPTADGNSWSTGSAVAPTDRSIYRPEAYLPVGTAMTRRSRRLPTSPWFRPGDISTGWLAHHGASVPIARRCL
jgi:hypothetical protein